MAGKAGTVAGWVISGLVAAFTALDGVAKLIRPATVAEAFARTGWPMDLSITLGCILLVCTLLFLIPRTAVLGGVLLTGYLGGAVATNLRLHNPWFSNTLFPVYFGVLVWVALWLRTARLKDVFPLA
jgi:DoxX-like family